MPKGIYNRNKKKEEVTGAGFVIPDQAGYDDDDDIVNELEQDASINKHEGSKYLRVIHSCLDGSAVRADIYEVLDAFNVTCPAVQHACSKLLASGQRGKGSVLDDLVGAKAAVERAIELERRRERCRNGKS
jgi:hypothetical protein